MSRPPGSKPHQDTEIQTEAQQKLGTLGHHRILDRMSETDDTEPDVPIPAPEVAADERTERNHQTTPGNRPAGRRRRQHGRYPPRTDVTARQRRFLVRLFDGVYGEGRWPPATLAFYTHVLQSLCAPGPQSDRQSVPVPSEYARNTWQVRHMGRMCDPLVEAELLSFTPRRRNRCREYAVPGHVLDAFVAAALEDVRRADDRLPIVGVINGHRARMARSSTPGVRADEMPSLAKQAADAIYEAQCPFDFGAARDYLAELEEALAAAGDIEHQVVSARARLAQTVFCIKQALLSADVDGDKAVYRPTFNSTYTGRLTEIGGFQSAPRALKRRVWEPLEHSHGLVNYDLKSSQPNALVQLFRAADADPAFLHRYIESDRTDLAFEALGSRDAEIVDLYKTCVIALFMGAQLPSPYAFRGLVPVEFANLQDDVERRRMQRTPDIARSIWGVYGTAEHGDPWDAVGQALAGFRDHVAAFDRERKVWLRYIAGPYLEAHATIGRAGRVISNAVGGVLRLKGLSASKTRRKLAAHLLQGLEAEFIHRLTLLGPEYEFVAVSNQHDGLVTQGVVPPEAVEQARAESEIEVADLVVKPYE